MEGIVFHQAHSSWAASYDLAGMTDFSHFLGERDQCTPSLQIRRALHSRAKTDGLIVQQRFEESAVWISLFDHNRARL